MRETIRPQAEGERSEAQESETRRSAGQQTRILTRRADQLVSHSQCHGRWDRCESTLGVGSAGCRRVSGTARAGGGRRCMVGLWALRVRAYVHVHVEGVLPSCCLLLYCQFHAGNWWARAVGGSTCMYGCGLRGQIDGHGRH